MKGMDLGREALGKYMHPCDICLKGEGDVFWIDAHLRLISCCAQCHLMMKLGKMALAQSIPPDPEDEEATELEPEEVTVDAEGGEV